jgi:PKD repeat protein
MTFDNRVNQIVDLIKDEGYNINVNYIVDWTNGNNTCDFLTFLNFTNFTNGGINYWNSHGSKDIENIDEDGFIEVFYTSDTDTDWIPNSILSGYFMEVEYPIGTNGWSGSLPPRVIVAFSSAAEEYWQNNITLNKCITILETCYSYQNGFVEACGTGGATFGYQQVSYFQTATPNYNKLIKRLNGIKKSGNSFLRNTFLAFTDAEYQSGFNMYPPNANITLCPATKEIFPANSTIVPSIVTQGYFEIDTWCNAAIPAEEALTFNENGDINITNVYWENGSTGKSNKIIYNWTGTQGSVTVNVHTDKIVAYGGGGQMLDFDGVTPNGETGVYYVFQIGSGTVQNVDFYSDNTYIFENTEVQFTDISSLDNPLSYHWDFGDGSTSILQNPAHLYDTEGNYNITLTVSTPLGNLYETKTNYISVYNESSGDLSCTNNVTSDKTVEFHAFYTGAYEPNAYEYRFTIDYGDGNTQEEHDIYSSADFSHEYSDYGTYETTVYVEILSQFEEVIYAVGCDCASVELYDPFPCSDLQANFSISPEIAYLHGSLENSSATVNFYDLTTGGNNYTWNWYFLGDLENDYEPVGGITIEHYQGQSGNPQSKTYSHAGIYPVVLEIMDGNGCAADTTKNVMIAEPFACINNLKVLSNGSDQLLSSNRLIVPWREDNQECMISLKNEFEFYQNCLNNDCNDCGEEWQSYRWYINGENVITGIIEQSQISNQHIDQTNIDFSAIEYLLPYKNIVGCVIEGRNMTNDYSHSCYDSTNIEIVAINCEGFMNSSSFIFSYMANSNLFMPDFTENGFMIDSDNFLEFYSGKIELNSDVNQIVNNNDVVLLACNGILLTDGFTTGSQSFIVQGGSVGYTIEGCEPMPNNYSLLITDDETTAIKTKPELEVLPNPVSESFQIKVNHPVDDYLLLELFDAQGRLIQEITKGEKTTGYYYFQINNFDVKSGLYFCRYTNSQETITRKFIKKQNNDK